MKKVNEEKKLQLFKEQPEFQQLCKFMQNKYVALYNRLTQAEAIPDAEVIKRFGYAKPLVRLRKCTEAYGTSMERECVDHRCKVMGGNKKSDLLAWAVSDNLNDDFVKEFGPRTVLRYGNGTLSTGKLEQLAEFTIYSVPYLMPNDDMLVSVSTAEVLRQLPPEVSPDEQYAFELNLPADFVDEELYDEVLDCMAVPVILYRVVDGYAPEIAKVRANCRSAVADIF